MVASAGRIAVLATAMASRASEILSAPVLVIDENGLALARAGSGSAVWPDATLCSTQPAACLQAPVVLDGRPCRLVVAVPPSGEPANQRLAQAAIERVISQTAVVDRLPSQHALKNKFVYDLLHDLLGGEPLHGEIDAEAGVRRKGQILGIDLSRPRAVVLVDAASHILVPDEAPRVLDGEPEGEECSRTSSLRTRRVIAAIVRFFGLPTDAICAYIGDGEFAILKASATRDLAGWAAPDAEPGSPAWTNLTALKRAGNELLCRLREETGAEINIGIGRYHPGLRGLARSYEDARTALSLGRRLHGGSRLHSLDNLGVAAFVGLSDEATKIALGRHLLSPLEQEPELLETLEIFFAENCCPSSAAGRIPVHRNTLSYRLDKVASLTGLNPRRFDDAVQIRLALVLRRFDGDRRDPAPPRSSSFVQMPNAGGGPDT